MSAVGTWQLQIRTPIGRQKAFVEFNASGAGPAGFRGVVHTEADDTVLRDVIIQGDQLSWNQSVTRPMKLDLHFQVTVAGDTLTGTAEAGRLPSSQVTGTRQP